MMNRWKPNSGELFKGAKPEPLVAVDAEKVLDILLGQLEVLRMITAPAIYLPTETEETKD